MTLSTQTLIDISLPIFPGMVTYPRDPTICFKDAKDIGCGDAANITEISIGSHTGTHFDTPFHILNQGFKSDGIPLDKCYGPAQVIEIPAQIQAIDKTVLAAFDLQQSKRLLLKTRNSAFWQANTPSFREDYAALTEDGAEYLVQLGIELVGIDYISIELYGTSGLKAHKALLNRNILILEGINLAQVDPGIYTLMAFPLKYQGLDGAPARAILLK